MEKIKGNKFHIMKYNSKKLQISKEKAEIKGTGSPLDGNLEDQL